MQPVQKSSYPPETLTKDKYLRNMFTTFQQFQHTRSPEVLKLYAKKNRQQLAACINALPQYQNSLAQSQISFNNDKQSKNLQLLKEINKKLEKQYAEQLQISRGANLRASQIRIFEQEKEMNSTLMSLNEQLEKLTEEYNQGFLKIEKKRFFKEWNLMNKQFQGAKSLNGKLKIQLQKKKNEIKNLTH